ncbi:MAG: tRNA pseudouridine(38-40) synthase TruA [Spirosomataceae bacterium]
MRFFIELAYNGTAYHGWQIQPQATTVQETIEKALSTLLRQPVEIVGSGRTDTGVHAEQQFAHFDTQDRFDPVQLVYRLNKLLPPDIAIRQIVEVPAQLHARFDATYRKYEYRICRRKSPFLPNMAYFFERPLDVALMNQAAQKLLQYNDFQSFSLVNTQVYTFDCTITEAHWLTQGDMLVFHIKANRFLRGMVRAIVGTLLDVGLGKRPVATFDDIILAKDRRKAGQAAPPEGLFLTEVGYPSNAWGNP